MPSTTIMIILLILCFHHLVTTTSAATPTNTISALVGAGDFSNWDDLLSSIDPALIPFSATLFLPPASANASRVNLLYHIVPQRLAFSELQAYPAYTRLPTLAPGMTLLLTNTSLSNFSINHIPLTRPNLFLNAAVTAHAVAAPLDFDPLPVPVPTSSQNMLRRSPRRPRKGPRKGRKREPPASEGPMAPEGSKHNKRKHKAKLSWWMWCLIALAATVLLALFVFGLSRFSGGCQ